MKIKVNGEDSFLWIPALPLNTLMEAEKGGLFFFPVEDDYLSRHSLVPGVAGFLRNAKHQRIPVWCLSNDIDRWSRKLSAACDIEGLLAGAIVSSAVNVRKPDRRIYQFLFDQSGYRAEDLLFVR